MSFGWYDHWWWAATRRLKRRGELCENVLLQAITAKRKKYDALRTLPIDANLKYVEDNIIDELNTPLYWARFDALRCIIWVYYASRRAVCLMRFLFAALIGVQLILTNIEIIYNLLQYSGARYIVTSYNTCTFAERSYYARWQIRIRKSNTAPLRFRQVYRESITHWCFASAFGCDVPILAWRRALSRADAWLRYLFMPLYRWWFTYILFIHLL